MDRETEKPLRLFVNPFTIWTQLAFKTGEALWATAHAAALRASAPKVAVVPDDTSAPQPPAKDPKVAVLPVAHARPRKARAAVKATRAKLRSKAGAKRRARR